MTNVEAISAIIGNRVEIDYISLRSVLSLNGFDPDGEYQVSDKCAIYGLALPIIAGDASAGITSISEGGYSVTYDKAGKSTILYQLALQSGCNDLIGKYNPNPTVTGKKVW